MEVKKILLWFTKILLKGNLNKLVNGESPFYFAVNNLKLRSLGTKNWFKANDGIYKINSLMKTMAQKAGLKKQQAPKPQR